MNQKTTIHSMLALGITAALFTISGCANMYTAKVPDIKTSMQDMKNALQPAMQAGTMDEFKPHAATFKASVLKAAQANYPGTLAEQTKYQEGMKKMQTGLAQLDATIATGDLAAAKTHLKNLFVVRDEYHKILKNK